jgi:hypothetical protein
MARDPGRGIILSPKYGANPAIPRCWFCLEDKNEIILAGRMKGDMEAPRGAVWDKSPCDKCAEWMRQGIILIGVKDNQPKSDNPERSGHFIVIREDAIRRAPIDPAMIELVCERRVAFMEVRALVHFGVITEEEAEEEVAS